MRRMLEKLRPAEIILALKKNARGQVTGPSAKETAEYRKWRRSVGIGRPKRKRR